jgi:hypothetical protein
MKQPYRACETLSAMIFNSLHIYICKNSTAAKDYMQEGRLRLDCAAVRDSLTVPEKREKRYAVVQLWYSFDNADA